MLRSTKLRKLLIASGIAVLLIGVILSILFSRLSPLNRRWAVNALSRYYHSKVTLQSFHVTLFPRIEVSGGGLVLADKVRPGGAPLASVRRFSLQATWLGLLRRSRQVRHVRLEGLIINVPPRQKHRQNEPRKKQKHHLPPLYLEDVEANGAVLNISSNNPRHPPRVFVISKLRLRSVGVGKAMSFQATLTNPKPIGQIQTSGEFGPWNPDHPNETPVFGKYVFRDADLSTIRGIAGMLSSEGEFKGKLDRIEVDGTTDTPEFALGASGNSEPLKTRFHAIVDATTGQTLLQPVRARLGNSLIIARGGVYRQAHVQGTTVLLNVTTDRANLADVLRLAVKGSEPPMTGAVSVRTRFEVAPGSENIEKRLKLDGTLTIQDAKFTDSSVQKKVTHLSESGQGKPGKGDGEQVISNFRGHFALSASVMSFSSVWFHVPGASVHLHGTYGLESENLNFLGELELQATLSHATTGIKSLLLRPLNPLFKGRHAGTVLPIKISGNRQHPRFGLQYGKLWKRSR